MKVDLSVDVKNYNNAQAYYQAVVNSCPEFLHEFLKGDELEKEIKQAWVDQVDNVIQISVTVSFTKTMGL